MQFTAEPKVGGSDGSKSVGWRSESYAFTLSRFHAFTLGSVALLAVPSLAGAQAPVLDEFGDWEAAFPHGPHAVGCPGSTAPFVPVHACLIPNTNKVLVWDKSSDVIGCGQLAASGYRDQRYAILDFSGPTVTITKYAWRILPAETPDVPCQPQLYQGHQNMFCAGHCWLPDGRLLAAGGDFYGTAACLPAPFPLFAGSRLLCLFDPSQTVAPNTLQIGNSGGHWTTMMNANTPVGLQKARWYPTVTMVGNSGVPGSVWIAITGGVEKFYGGLPAPPDASFNSYEAFFFNLTTNTLTRDLRAGATTPGLFAGPTTPSASSLSFIHYPRMHYASDRTLGGGTTNTRGRLWMIGMARESGHVDVNMPNTWPVNGPVIPNVANHIDESTTVRMPNTSPAYDDVFLVIGGETSPGVFSNQVYSLDTKQVAAPGNLWNGMLPMPAMQRARKFANAVLVPDASIVVIGGGRFGSTSGTGPFELQPETFFNGQWNLGPQADASRGYHSTAILLPNGKVLTCGGENSTPGMEYQVFVPHCLVGSPYRPQWAGATPASVGYGGEIGIGYSMPVGQTLARVVLMAPAALTHHHDSNQRYVQLGINGLNLENTGAMVIAPANATQAPPGWYMMFIVSSAGVPSVARWIRIGV